MRRTIATILILALCACLLTVTASAASSASMSGPGTVRAGDTITVTFSVSGSGLLGLEGVISYDSSFLTLQKTEPKIGSPWAVEFNGNKFVAYDNNQTNPINGSTGIFALTFKVSGSAATGASLQVSCTGIKVSDGSTETALGTASYTKEISRPLSGDNKLKSLSVGNATISPSFSANTTSYTAQVPYSVSKLDISARANDGNAKVSIHNPTLTPNGTTNVTVTVTAENGSKRTYTIAVTREQDPNYVKSSDNNLSALGVEGFLLSPVFTPENTNYLVWLPYETESVWVTGMAADSKAALRVEGGENLAAGADNEIKVICTAEDGSERVYTIIAKRGPAHDGSTEPTEPEPTEPETTATTQPETEPAQTTQPEADPNAISLRKGMAILIAALILVAGLGLGIVIGRVSRG